MRRIFRPKAHKFIMPFKNDGRDFSAYYEAKGWLHNHGFSYGSTDGSPYMAVVKGEYNLPQKLYNFTKGECDLIDGVVFSNDFRNGYVEIRLYNEFKEEAK